MTPPERPSALCRFSRRTGSVGSSRISGLRPADDLEFLNAAAPVGLRHIDAALGIDRDRVVLGEIADLVVGAAGVRQGLFGGVLQYLHLLCAAIHHLHELLLAIGRERHPPGRATGSRAAFKPLPRRVPSTESNFPPVPTCSRSLPSGAYFWMAPSALPATQTLPS